MKVELKKWALADKKQLMDICNSVERDYLSDQLPYPYTEECADWWLNMVLEHDGKDGVFRAIVADGRLSEIYLWNKKAMFIRKMRKSATCWQQRSGHGGS